MFVNLYTHICALTIFIFHVVGTANANPLSINSDLTYIGSFNKTSYNSEATCEALYYVWTTPDTWNGASERCRSTNGVLLSIENKEENDYVHELIKTQIREPIWTSGTFDAKTKAFRWYSSRDAFAYTNWGPNQPIISNPTFPVYFWSDMAGTSNWQVHSATSLKRFVCEDSCRTPKRCDTRVELAIVLDGSGSIHPDDFGLAKVYISLLMSAYGSPSRITFIVYSDDALTIFNIDHSLSPYDMDEKVREAKQPRELTYTNLGIDAAIAQLSSSPAGVPRKMVVFTDGASNDRQKTILSAQNAKANGITAYSIGIGNYNHPELLAIASGRQENIFTFVKFNDLLDKMKEISTRVCVVD